MYPSTLVREPLSWVATSPLLSGSCDNPTCMRSLSLLGRMSLTQDTHLVTWDFPSDADTFGLLQPQGLA